MPWKTSDLLPELQLSEPARGIGSSENLPGWTLEAERPAPGKGDRLVTAAQPLIAPKVTPERLQVTPEKPQVSPVTPQVRLPQGAGPGAMGESWGMLSPEGAQADLRARRAQYDDISRRLTQYDRMIASANEYSRPQLEAQRIALAADLPDLKQLEAMEAGTAPLATKTALRSGVENVVTGAGETLLGVPEMVGIVKGYLAPGQVDDDSLVKWSLGAKDWLRTQFPGDAARQQDFSQQLASGLGQIATFYGSGMTAALLKAGPKVSAAVVALLGGSTMGSQGFEEGTRELQKARADAAAAGDAASVTEFDRLLKTLGYGALGLTEAAPVMSTLTRAVPGATTRAGQRLIAGAEGAVEEAAQEAGSQIGQNLVTQATTDPERKTWEGVTESAGVGGVLGGLMGGLIPGKFTPPSPEALGRRDLAVTDAPLEGFYSPGARAVETVKQEKMPASQWVGALEKQDPAAGREARDLGLDIWLEEQGGGKAVTRKEIKDWLDAHQVEVETRTFTDDNLREKRSRIRPFGENYAETILKPKGLDYSSKHFNENEVVIVSHADRAGPNGERYLATEQVQSDLHQKGRKEGYQEEGGEKLNRLLIQFNVPIADYKDNSFDRKLDKLLDKLGDLPDTDPRKPELRNQLRNLRAQKFENRGKVPNAPFKGDLWWQLGLKWAIGNAARNGYDGIVVARPDQAAQASMGSEEKLTPLYGKKVPDWLKKYVKSLGGELVQEVLPNYGAERPRITLNPNVDGQAIIDFLQDYAQNGEMDYVRRNVMDTIVNGSTPNLAKSFAAEYAVEGFAGQKVPELYQGFTRKDGTFVPPIAQPIKNWVVKFTPKMQETLGARGQSQYAAAGPAQKTSTLKRGINQLRGAVTLPNDLDSSSARREAALLVNSGRTVAIPPAAVQPIFDAAKSLGTLIPADVPVMAMTKVESLSANKLRATYSDAKGKTKSFIYRPDELFTSRAATETDGAGRSFILLTRFNGAEAGDQRIVGELWHETVHALRRQNRLVGANWTRLLDHAENLRILDMDFREFLRAIQSPKWEEAPGGVSVRELYNDLYADAYANDPGGLEAAVREEGVTHMVELAQHGAANLTPVQDVIDRLQAGLPKAANEPDLSAPVFWAKAEDFAKWEDEVEKLAKHVKPEAVSLPEIETTYPKVATAVYDLLGKTYKGWELNGAQSLWYSPPNGPKQLIGFNVELRDPKSQGAIDAFIYNLEGQALYANYIELLADSGIVPPPDYTPDVSATVTAPTNQMQKLEELVEDAPAAVKSWLKGLLDWQFAETMGEQLKLGKPTLFPYYINQYGLQETWKKDPLKAALQAADTFISGLYLGNQQSDLTKEVKQYLDKYEANANIAAQLASLEKIKAGDAGNPDTTATIQKYIDEAKSKYSVDKSTKTAELATPAKELPDHITVGQIEAHPTDLSGFKQVAKNFFPDSYLNEVKQVILLQQPAAGKFFYFITKYDGHQELATFAGEFFPYNKGDAFQYFKNMNVVNDAWQAIDKMQKKLAEKPEQSQASVSKPQPMASTQPDKLKQLESFLNDLSHKSNDAWHWFVSIASYDTYSKKFEKDIPHYIKKYGLSKEWKSDPAAALAKAMKDYIKEVGPYQVNNPTWQNTAAQSIAIADQLLGQPAEPAAPPKPIMPVKFTSLAAAVSEVGQDYAELIPQFGDKLALLMQSKVLWEHGPDFMAIGNDVAAFTKVLEQRFFDRWAMGDNPYSSELERLAMEKLYYDLHPKYKPEYSSATEAGKQAPDWIKKHAHRFNLTGFIDQYGEDAARLFAETYNITPGEGNWVAAHAIKQFFETDAPMNNEAELADFIASFLPMIVPFNPPSAAELKKAAHAKLPEWELNPDDYEPARYTTPEAARVTLGKFARNVWDGILDEGAIVKKYATPGSEGTQKVVSAVGGYIEGNRDTLAPAVYDQLKAAVEGLKPTPKKTLAIVPEAPAAGPDLNLPPKMSYSDVRALVKTQSNDVALIVDQVVSELVSDLYVKKGPDATNAYMNSEEGELALSAGLLDHLTRYPAQTEEQRLADPIIRQISDALAGKKAKMAISELNERLRLDLTSRKFTFSGKAGGGSKPKEIWTDEMGKEYLFKPVQKGKEYLADGEIFGAKMSQIVTPESAPLIFQITLNDRYGSLQQYLPAEGDLGGKKIENLSWKDLSRLMREHVVDWMISNHDGHAKQFLRGTDGNIVAIDKGQAFKYLGKDKLAVDYHPNAQHGEQEPIYNKLWRAYRDGRLTKQLLEGGATQVGKMAEVENLLVDKRKEVKDLTDKINKHQAALDDAINKVNNSPYSNFKFNYTNAWSDYWIELSSVFRKINDMVTEPFKVDNIPADIEELIVYDGQVLMEELYGIMEGLAAGTPYEDMVNEIMRQDQEVIAEVSTMMGEGLRHFAYLISQYKDNGGHNVVLAEPKDLRWASSPAMAKLTGWGIRTLLEKKLQEKIIEQGPSADKLTPEEFKKAQEEKFLAENEVRKLQDQKAGLSEQMDQIFYAPVLDAIKTVQERIPDELFLELLEPYARGRFPNDARRAAFLDYALERKNNLADKFWKFFLQITDPRRRAGSLVNANEVQEEIKQDPNYTKSDLTELEKSALKSYTGSGFKSLNQQLKTEKAVKEGQINLDWLRRAADAEILSRALKKLPPYIGPTYRGQARSNDAAQFKAGKIWTAKAFVSTSKEPSSAFGGQYRFVINSLTGRYIRDYSDSPGEEEVLYMPGTQFLITKVIVTPAAYAGNQPTTTIFMEELPDVNFNDLD